MALILSLIRWKEDSSHVMPAHPEYFEDALLKCRNPKCISHGEPVRPLFHKSDDGTVRCVYCDSKI